jgi:hypothetical protein
LNSGILVVFCHSRSAWILKPDSLPSSYIAFLNKHGGKDLSIIRGFKELALKMEPFSALKAIEEYYKSTGVDLKLDPNMSIPCTVMTSFFSMSLLLLLQ